MILGHRDAKLWLCRATPVALAAGALLFLGLGRAVRADQPTTVNTTIEVETQVGDNQSTITIHGDADLADDYVLTVAFASKGIKVLEQEVHVSGKKYSAKFGPWKKILLPGKYEAVLALMPAAQKAQFKTPAAALRLSKERAPVEVGTPADQAARAMSVKKKLVDVLEGMRLAYIELNQAGTYYRADLQMANINSRLVNIPPADQEANKKKYQERQAQLLPAWKDTAQSNWEERFKTARYDWKIFREQVVATPYPEVEQKIEQLVKTLEVWYRGMNAAIFALCNQPLPKEETDGGAADPLKLDPEIVQAAHLCYTDLGYPEGDWPQWRISDLSEGERGDVKDDWYKSYVSKFMIKKPDGWGFTLGGVRPSARLRFTPPEVADPKKRTETIIVVEILDFAAATDMKNLAALAREMNRNRWRGAKETRSDNISAPDSTMIRGTRPGIDSEFLIEGAHKVRVRYYQLFCRWHKRTYGVLCIAPDEQFSTLSDTFRKTCNSFRVLDAPEFHDLADKERREAIRKEGRNPDEAYKKMDEFQHPDNKALEQDPKKESPK